MILPSAESDRRVLTFPAVHPCIDISPVTLLNSLIQLGREILRFKLKSISTNKRNARETLSQLHNILVFLEEMAIGSDLLPDSAVARLSELHLIFQKLKFLLEDCTRDGVRLWMLMNSERVAAHFRDMIRSISTSLDVFPFGSVYLSSEIYELIDLVVRQTRRARIGSDPDDKLVASSVDRILGQFEDAVIPDQNEIIRILDHIGVTKWSGCNKEIRFLETEIETLYPNEDYEKKKKKSSKSTLLSSLMGFMSYSRCVIFRFMDTESDNNKDIVNNGDIHLLRGLNPDDFRCPISFDIMTDPVTLSTGHTYDRSSILKWFRSGNPICPKTGERLINTELIPNLVIKRLIKHYCVQNGKVFSEAGRRRNRRVTTKTAEPGSLAAAGAVKLLAGFLADDLVDGEDEQIGKAAYEIRVLTRTNAFNGSYLIEAGVVPLLLNLLTSRDPETQEDSMSGLLNLSKHNRGKHEIVKNGGLEFIVEVLKKGIKTEAKQHAAASMSNLASIEDYNRSIGENPDAISGLVDMIRSSITTNHAKKDALMAIAGLLMTPDNHWRVLAAGAIPLLLGFIKSEENSELIAGSLAILSKLAENPDGTISIIRRGGLKLPVKILGSPEISPAAKQQCVALLLNLCVSGGGDVVGALVNSPSLMGSLYTVLSGSGGLGGSQKASTLIKMLQEFHERRTGSGSLASVLRSERFVPAW